MDASTTSGRFSFQSCKVLLTYPTHLDKAMVLAFVERAGNLPVKFLRAAHETGTSNNVPYAHTHVLARWKATLKTVDCRRFDIVLTGGVLHPNWQPIKTETHWRNQVAYIAKEDPDNADLLVKTSVVTKVWAADTLTEALLSCVQKPADVLGVTALYNARPSATIEVDLPDRPWQTEVLAFCETRPDRRSVHWFYDPVGGAGKTWLARYMMANTMAYMVKQCGGSSNFATIMAGAIASGWDQKVFILDLPRSAEEHSFYGCLEEVCDGCVTATKYQGGTVLFNQPHVLVFANFKPNRSKMSQDRWRVHHIASDGCLDKPILGCRTVAAGPNPPLPGCLTLIEPMVPAPPKWLPLVEAIARNDNISMMDIEDVLRELL